MIQIADAVVRNMEFMSKETLYILKSSLDIEMFNRGISTVEPRIGELRKEIRKLKDIQQSLEERTKVRFE